MCATVTRPPEAQLRVEQLVSQRRCLICEEPIRGKANRGQCKECSVFSESLVQSGDCCEADLVRLGVIQSLEESWGVSTIPSRRSQLKHRHPRTINGQAQRMADAGSCVFCDEHVGEPLSPRGHCRECSEIVEREIAAGNLTEQELVDSGRMLADGLSQLRPEPQQQSAAQLKRLALRKALSRSESGDDAIPADDVTPGRWLLRWFDGQNQEHVRKVVVTDTCDDIAMAEAAETLARLRASAAGNQSARRPLWVRFVDDQWQPRPDSSPLLVSYLPDTSTFLPVGGEHTEDAGDE